MLSRDTLLPLARRIEAALHQDLRRYETALARLRERADAEDLGPALDALASWADVAPLLTDLLTGPDGAAGAMDDPGRIWRIAAAHVRPDAIRFVQAVTSPRDAVDRIAHPCSRFLVQDAHRLCHPEGLDTVDYAGAPVTFQPGHWRRWPVGQDTPAPAALDALMTAWADVFSSSLWDRRHPVVHCTLAAIALAGIRPFPAGNAAVAQLVAHGVLRRRGAPACPTFLAADALEAGGLEPAAASADALVDRCARVATVLAAQLEAAPGHLDRLQHLGEAFARAIPAFPARYTLRRGELARAVGGRPLDTPAALAWRQGLSRDATQRILRRLIATGHLHLARVNARQVVLSPAAIELLQDLRRATDGAGPTPSPAAGLNTVAGDAGPPQAVGGSAN